MKAWATALGEPVRKRCCDELAAVVRAKDARSPVALEELRERGDDVAGADRVCDPRPEREPGVLVDDVEDPDRSARVGPCVEEVIGPDVVWPRRRQVPRCSARAG